MDKTNDYTIFAKHGYPALANGMRSNISWQPLWCPTRHAMVWSQLRLPLALSSRSFDVIHVPGHRVPWIKRGRLITTLHDLVFLQFPETLRSGHRNRLVWYTKNAVRSADSIITVSETVKRSVCEFYRTDPSKIVVIHHGVDHMRFHSDITPLRRPLPYILTVGTLQPLKNQVTLIRAFKQLCARWREPIDLVIAGQRGWMWESIEEEARKLPFADRVHLLGHVTHEVLPSLYAGATFVAMPSLYEGFGLPLLEAMACGAPLVTANISTFSEVAGDAALMLDPHNTEAWMEGMLELLDNAERRQQLRQKGLARARQFSWERTAKETLAIYRKVTAG